MPTLTDYIRAQVLLSIGHGSANPDHTDFMTAFGADPALVAEARAELATLTALGAVLRRDWEARAKRDTLQTMLARYDAG